MGAHARGGDGSGALADTRLAERMTVRQLLERYLLEITPTKRSASSESYRIKALIGLDIAYRTLALLAWEEAAVEAIIRRYVGRQSATLEAIRQIDQTRRRT
jgi:hypothetical protein